MSQLFGAIQCDYALKCTSKNLSKYNVPSLSQPNHQTPINVIREKRKIQKKVESVVRAREVAGLVL